MEIRIILSVFRRFSLENNTGFLALRCILSQRNPKCTTWLDEDVTNRVASTRSFLFTAFMATALYCFMATFSDF